MLSISVFFIFMKRDKLDQDHDTSSIKRRALGFDALDDHGKEGAEMGPDESDGDDPFGF